jgi:serine/threonine-protein phosphatase Stp1
MRSALRIDDCSATHVGEVRSENEDSFVALREAGVWLIADGMGGLSNGQYASRTIADLIAATPIPDTIEGACDAISDAVQLANAEILDRARQAGSQMGSTFVALVVRDGEFAVLWSGDSRAYIFRHGALHRLTQDHTQVQAMIERGLLTADEALEHPMRHVLSRAVGVEECLQIDAVRDHIEPSDLFLLCSDGLHGLVPETEIADMLARYGARGCDELIALCLARGAPDNITITLVSARERTLLVLGGAQS